MECRCDTVAELYRREAERYACEHLACDETQTDSMEKFYACPRDTGRQRVLDFPERPSATLGKARLSVGT